MKVDTKGAVKWGAPDNHHHSLFHYYNVFKSNLLGAPPHSRSPYPQHPIIELYLLMKTIGIDSFPL